MWSRGGLPPRLSVRTGLQRRWPTRRWPWRGNGPLKRPVVSGGASASNSAVAELGSGSGRGEGGGDRENWGARGSRVASRPGHAGRSQAATATLPMYGRHVAGTGWRRAGTSTRGEEGRSWAAWLSGPKGWWVGPAARAPFLFFNLFFPNIFQAHFDLFKFFSRLGP